MPFAADRPHKVNDSDTWVPSPGDELGQPGEARLAEPLLVYGAVVHSTV
jgi:hypothetical protein